MQILRADHIKFRILCVCSTVLLCEVKMSSMYKLFILKDNLNMVGIKFCMQHHIIAGFGGAIVTKQS